MGGAAAQRVQRLHGVADSTLAGVEQCAFHRRGAVARIDRERPIEMPSRRPGFAVAHEQRAERQVQVGPVGE